MFCYSCRTENTLLYGNENPRQKSDTMSAAVVKMLSQFPPEPVKTVTCDRGSEFADWKTIEQKRGRQVYFADPYCARQKGTNENYSGLLREFYPQGRHLARVSPKTLLRSPALMNAGLRKVLGFISAQDSRNLELQKFS